MNQYAKLGTRLACHLGDLIIIQIIVLPLYMLLEFMDWLIDYELVTMVVWAVYSTIMNSGRQKGTYGKRLMGVKVETEDGERLNFVQSLVRYILGFLLFGIFIGMLPIFFNSKKKGLHDIMMGTVVRYRF
ncbi:RDD family protein [Fulvivirga ligni]|uniref:RDD family protein n=1 Tax=Fulvivirga ligni TaxID=2904246 RepID=UPI001F1715DA|nr:RDD family protein [Fulvivirga ligni]UII23571.1 RDD family protein [Fulvivirga ligni]